MYRVRLQHFEGPLDLLLFFIRRDELDIYDIPIARIADEYLSYVRVLEQIDLDGVGDFLYMAALLINIKARMLLPSPEVDEEGEPIDPRQELVERLLEYIRFKEASENLARRLERREDLFTRGQASAVDEQALVNGEELAPATVFELISALRRILTEAAEEPVHAVLTEAYSVEEQQEVVMHALSKTKRQSFAALVSGRTKAYIITTFLAVLELARQGFLHIRLAQPFAFFVEATAAADRSNGARTTPENA